VAAAGVARKCMPKRPTISAFVLAMVSGTLLATGEYLGGAIAAFLAIILMAAWDRARGRGEDYSGPLR
jgi:hypothetical protein